MDAIADGLAVMTDRGPRLLASRCPACHALSFPRRQSCMRCPHVSIDDELLAETGTLWTWTVQTFRPKPPFPQDGEFVPFGVGYIELEGQLRVEARLAEQDPTRLRIGMPMRLQLMPIPGVAGDSVTFVFGPIP
jgi:uncharacterized OB-fold protein